MDPFPRMHMSYVQFSHSFLLFSKEISVFHLETLNLDFNPTFVGIDSVLNGLSTLISLASYFCRDCYFWQMHSNNPPVITFIW